MRSDAVQPQKTPVVARLVQFLIAQGVGLVLTFIMLLIMASTLCSKDYSHKLIPGLSLICLGVGALSAGLVFAALCHQKGWLVGGLSGLALATLLVLIGMCITAAATSDLLVRLGVGFGSGLLGGILGVNLKRPNPYK